MGVEWTAGIALLLGSMWLYLFVRVNLVYLERKRVLAVIRRESQRDVEADREWRRRYEAFDTGASFNRMVLEFWKPVDSYFEEIR